MMAGTHGKPERSVLRESPLSPLKAMQREHVLKVLDIANHDLAAAAVLLDIRVTELRRLMKRLDIP